MSKRKKYNGRERLKQLVKGSSIIYAGEKNEVSGRMANGLPMGAVIFDYVREERFRWRISLTVHANKGANVKKLSEEFSTQQATHINDLTDYVHEINTKLMLQMPEGFSFRCMTWNAKIL